MQQVQDMPTEITDEAWWTLCSMIVELDMVHEILEDTLLNGQRPTPDQLHTAITMYRHQTRAMYEFFEQQLHTGTEANQ